LGLTSGFLKGIFASKRRRINEITLRSGPGGRRFESSRPDHSIDCLEKPHWESNSWEHCVDGPLDHHHPFLPPAAPVTVLCHVDVGMPHVVTRDLRSGVSCPIYIAMARSLGIHCKHRRFFESGISDIPAMKRQFQPNINPLNGVGAATRLSSSNDLWESHIESCRSNDRWVLQPQFQPTERNPCMYFQQLSAL
jgi:hypothetical protein